MRQGQAIFAIDRDGGSADEDDEEEEGLDQDEPVPAPNAGRNGGRNAGGRSRDSGRNPDRRASGGGRNPGRNRGATAGRAIRRILRSLDRGESWQPFVDEPLRLRPVGDVRRRPLPRASLRPRRLLHPGAERLDDPQVDLRRHAGLGRPQRHGRLPGRRPPDGMFIAMSLAIDRRHPDVMYVMNSWDGVPNKFFRTVDGGRSWENISEGFPGTFVRGLEVSPTTGDVFTGSANGSRVLPPPYRETSAARSTAPSVWGQRFLDRPY